MKNQASFTPPVWSARTHVLTGSIALIVFIAFWAIWAGKDTVSGARIVDGILESPTPTSDAEQTTSVFELSEANRDLTIVVMQPMSEGQSLGQSVAVNIMSPGQTPVVELTGTISGMTLQERDSKVTFTLSNAALERANDVLLYSGAPVSMVVTTPPRAPLAFLLDPIFAYF